MVTLAPRWVSELHMIPAFCDPRTQLPEGDQSVHYRHFHIQQDEIGMKVLDGAQGRSPSPAVPATSNPASAQTTERSRLRITAESSTIRIRVRRPEAIAQASTRPSMASFSVSASSSKGFIRYSSAPHRERGG